jgi:hypothetical protein
MPFFVADVLAELFPEAEPMEYYRGLFPEDLMEEKGRFEEGKYCGICITLAEDGKARRTQVTKGLEELPALIEADEFSMMAPMLFAGRKASNDNARYLTALEFDLDFLRVKGGELVGIADFLYQTSLVKEDPFNRLPRPTFVIASSARNLHVVYQFDKPLAMYPHVLASVRNFRRAFIPRLWDSYITEANNKPQFETSPVQAFRLVGSKTKHGDAKVRCFKTGPCVNIEYMNAYSSNKIDCMKSSISLAEAKELYPSWYEKRIEKNLPRRAWECPEGLYEWWLKRMPEVQVGHRYHYMLCLSAYAQKCGIDEERLAKDMALCRKEMDKISPADNPLTMSDMAKALQAHQERYRTLPRHKISELSGLEIKPAKRNHRKQTVHLAIARSTKAVLNAVGEGHASNAGRPTKQQQVVDYFERHPNATVRKASQELGISQPTICKWRKHGKQAMIANEGSESQQAQERS